MTRPAKTLRSLIRRLPVLDWGRRYGRRELSADLLAAGYTMLRGEHVRIDIILGRFSKRTQIKVEIFGGPSGTVTSGWYPWSW